MYFLEDAVPRNLRTRRRVGIGRILQMGFFCRIRVFGLQNTLAVQSKGKDTVRSVDAESVAAWQHGMHGLVQKALSPQLAFPCLTHILVRGGMT